MCTLIYMHYAIWIWFAIQTYCFGIAKLSILSQISNSISRYLHCLAWGPGAGLAVRLNILCVFFLRAGVQHRFAFSCLNTSVITLSLPTGLDVQPHWQAARYLPIPRRKLKTTHDILADDIVSSALGKQLEKENGLKQKCLIEIAVSGKRGAGGLLVWVNAISFQQRWKKKTPVKWLFQITAAAMSFTLYYLCFSTGNILFLFTLLPIYIHLILGNYTYTFRGKPLIVLGKMEDLPFRYFCVLFIMSPLCI